MKKNIRICIYCFSVFVIFFISFSVSAQNKTFFLKPRSLSFDFNGNGMWQINEGLKGQWMDELRLRGQLQLVSNIGLVIENQTKFIKDGDNINDISQAYIQYSKAFSHKGKFPLFKHSTFINIKVGKIEWYPTFQDIRLISENLDLFTNPYSFYGLSFNLRMPLLKDNSLVFNFSGHSGDIIENDTKADIRNIYLSYNKEFIDDLGISIRVGKMQGCQHFINYAYLFYRPTIEKLQLGFKVGKLLSLDGIPYGFGVSIERKFKYIAVGGYYQRRINQKSYFEERNTSSQIFGFTWRIIGPKKLKKVINTYQFIYDTNTETFRFVIPFFLSNIQFK